MSRRARIGELLSQMVPLSRHDVEEILEEQSNNRLKFGEIAMSWGLCRAEHIWDAWCQQSSQEGETLDLERVGVDARAAALLNSEAARELMAIPVRVSGDMALVAIAQSPTQGLTMRLSELCGRRIKFVRADANQLLAMLAIYYPPTAQAI